METFSTEYFKKTDKKLNNLLDKMAVELTMSIDKELVQALMPFSKYFKDRTLTFQHAWDITFCEIQLRDGRTLVINQGECWIKDTKIYPKIAANREWCKKIQQIIAEFAKLQPFINTAPPVVIRF
jgi:hypothetical protein